MKSLQSVAGILGAAWVLGTGVYGVATFQDGTLQVPIGEKEIGEFKVADRAAGLEVLTRATKSKPLSIGILLFDGWEPLDVMGPYEIFHSLSYANNMTLSVISDRIGPITTRPPPHTMDPNLPPFTFYHTIQLTVQSTHTWRNAPALDVLLVPGGMGNMALNEQNNTWMEDFVAKRYPKLQYLLSVCTGSVTLAKAGVLKGKRATTNKASWGWVVQFGKEIKWVPSARWTEDGKIWTSSGVAAGLDMTYAFVKHLYGSGAVNPSLNQIEYVPHTNKDWDPFSVVWNVPGADTNRSLIDCSGPVSLS